MKIVKKPLRENGWGYGKCNEHRIHLKKNINAKFKDEGVCLLYLHKLQGLSGSILWPKSVLRHFHCIDYLFRLSTFVRI